MGKSDLCSSGKNQGGRALREVADHRLTNGDHALRNGSRKGIQAIIAYPINALANSQLGELRSAPAVSVGRLELLHHACRELEAGRRRRSASFSEGASCRGSRSIRSSTTLPEDLMMKSEPDDYGD